MSLLAHRAAHPGQCGHVTSAVAQGVIVLQWGSMVYAPQWCLGKAQSQDSQRSSEGGYPVLGGEKRLAS